MSEKFTFFFREESPFSQWHRVRFTINGQEFNCCEQAMMYAKAVMFGDNVVAEKILNTSKPYEQKMLGRKVANFNKDIWDANCKQIVYEANHAKFTQNPELLKKLLATEGTTLAEASPYDRIWGIGLASTNPRALDRNKWLGTNWLGEILTQLREDLIQKGAAV
ncbi:Swarming motility protein YbiA [compost metagenome]